MFRTFDGFKAHYHDLDLVVFSEFNEWKVFIHGPGVLVQGARQFGEAKAKEHAVAVARSYLREEAHEEVEEAPALDWAPCVRQDCLVWRG